MSKRRKPRKRGDYRAPNRAVVRPPVAPVAPPGPSPRASGGGSWVPLIGSLVVVLLLLVPTVLANAL